VWQHKWDELSTYKQKYGNFDSVIYDTDVDANEDQKTRPNLEGPQTREFQPSYPPWTVDDYLPSMDPYTPRKRAGSRKKNLTLSAKEYTKVSSG
jgi:hypothetical protein